MTSAGSVPLIANAQRAATGTGHFVVVVPQRTMYTDMLVASGSMLIAILRVCGKWLCKCHRIYRGMSVILLVAQHNPSPIAYAIKVLC